MRNQNTFDIESGLWSQGYHLIAGVDEAGRGPLAGPVIAAAVIFPQNLHIQDVNDSKKLTAIARERLYDQIISHSLAYGIGCVEPQEIDRINILQASLKAMKCAIDNLSKPPDFVLIDGNQPIKSLCYPQSPIVKGDSLCFSIAAASIIAKVYRDRLMREYDILYPNYGFARHKGYPTRKHIQAIHQHGLSPIHRRTFHVRQSI
ncbi:ribonuclease HII [candidate division KSB1 bacterium]|nr:ribonuclease HII [candidate division KSB1 bacterium]